MDKIDKVTGQRIDYKEHNDNAPPSYSAPDLLYKAVLQFHARQYCSRCGGTGYIGDFKSTSAGRCFKCIPDDRWVGLTGMLVETGSDDNSKEDKCQIRQVSSQFYPVDGYIVTGLLPLPPANSQVFPTIDAAREFASEKYGV